SVVTCREAKRASTCSRSTSCRAMASAWAGSPRSSTARSWTGCPARPPRLLTDATQARVASRPDCSAAPTGPVRVAICPSLIGAPDGVPVPGLNGPGSAAAPVPFDRPAAAPADGGQGPGADFGDADPSALVAGWALPGRSTPLRGDAAVGGRAIPGCGACAVWSRPGELVMTPASESTVPVGGAPGDVAGRTTSEPGALARRSAESLMALPQATVVKANAAAAAAHPRPRERRPLRPAVETAIVPHSPATQNGRRLVYFYTNTLRRAARKARCDPERRQL